MTPAPHDNLAPIELVLNENPYTAWSHKSLVLRKDTSYISFMIYNKGTY